MAILYAPVKYRSDGFPSKWRNTIRQDDAIEALRLAHDNGIKDTTRGAGAADTIHKGSPDVRGQVRTILHLICDFEMLFQHTST